MVEFSASMADAIGRATRLIDRTSDQVRGFLPTLAQRLALVYGLPILLAMLISSLGPLLIGDLLPQSTANLILLAINIFVLVQVWRRAEARWKSTGLFMLYTRYSRTRRLLRDMLERARAGSIDEPGALDLQCEQLTLDADRFVVTAQETGLSRAEAR